VVLHPVHPFMVVKDLADGRRSLRYAPSRNEPHTLASRCAPPAGRRCPWRNAQLGRTRRNPGREATPSVQALRPMRALQKGEVQTQAERTGVRRRRDLPVGALRPALLCWKELLSGGQRHHHLSRQRVSLVRLRGHRRQRRAILCRKYHDLLQGRLLGYPMPGRRDVRQPGQGQLRSSRRSGWSKVRSPVSQPALSRRPLVD